jgi:hypothetical protein
MKEGMIEWMYPNIYPSEGPRSVLKVGLYHVRAADDIEIEYDSERDGYIIFRTVTVGWTEPTEEKNYSEAIEKRKEVAFIPAWDEEEVEQP